MLDVLPPPPALLNGARAAVVTNAPGAIRHILDARRTLEGTAQSTRVLRAHIDLLREGEAADHLLLLTDGWACRYQLTREGTRQIVGLVLPGEIANLDALTTPRPGYAVRTLSTVTVRTLPGDRVLALAGQQPDVAALLLRRAMAENAILRQWTLGLGRRCAQSRIAHLLCELSTRLTGGEGEVARFDWPLTQEQIADALGLTPVHVNRMLQRIKALGLVSTAGRTVTIHDMPRLRVLADFDPAYLRTG